METQTLSTHKIIVFVVFVAAAIMASLFVYRANHQGTTNTNTSYLVFPAGRNIKNFDLVNANQSAFTQTQLYKHWTLMFFGFTHCTTVCPTTLSMLKQAYPLLHKQLPSLQVVFVSLDPARDDVKSLTQYTKRFNQDFVAVSGKTNELRKLQSQLGVFSKRVNTSPTDQYQLQHSSSILLISPNAKWVGMFKYGMNSQEFVHAFQQSIQKLEA